MYHPPKYYDLSYSYDMRDELAFVKRIFMEGFSAGFPRLLEPACGTGRLLVPLVRAGFRCTGFDINPIAVDYLKKNFIDRDWRRCVSPLIFLRFPSPVPGTMAPIAQ